MAKGCDCESFIGLASFPLKICFPILLEASFLICPLLFEYDYIILDVIESDEGTFYALLPTFDDPGESLEADGMYYIFEAIEEDGEQQLAEVEDEELLDRLSQIFESRFEELYEYDEEEDSENQ